MIEEMLFWLCDEIAVNCFGRLCVTREREINFTSVSLRELCNTDCARFSSACCSISCSQELFTEMESEKYAGGLVI